MIVRCGAALLKVSDDELDMLDAVEDWGSSRQ